MLNCFFSLNWYFGGKETVCKQFLWAEYNHAKKPHVTHASAITYRDIIKKCGMSRKKRKKMRKSLSKTLQITDKLYSGVRIEY